MSWVKEALAGLQADQVVTVQPHGGSMRGRIESGQLVTLRPVSDGGFTIDDAVFVRWGNNYLLHLVEAIDAGRVRIGNNLGKTNGWVPEEAVLGVVIDVQDKPSETGISTTSHSKSN